MPRRRPLGQYTLQARGVEGKYFYPMVEQAAALSRSNFATQGTQTITSITVPQSLLNGACIGNRPSDAMDPPTLLLPHVSCCGLRDSLRRGGA